RAVEGKVVRSVSRIGKRIVFAFDDDDLFLVLHLMIAGRLHWKPRGAKLPGKIGLVAFDFTNGMLILSEASTKKRASLHLVAGRDALDSFDRGGVDVLTAYREEFAASLRREN